MTIKSMATRLPAAPDGSHKQVKGGKIDPTVRDSEKAAVKRVSALETEEFFAARRRRADRGAFLRILNREGGEPPPPEDKLDGSQKS
jgi:hypothetical protein